MTLAISLAALLAALAVGMRGRTIVRKPAQSLEGRYEALISTAQSLRDRTEEDQKSVIAAMKVLGDEAARIANVRARLDGMGL